MKIDAIDGRTPLVLYLHCDTAAPWNFKRRWHDADQPHAVRIAALLHSHGTGQTRVNSWVLRVPSDAYFDRGSIAQHGITRTVCNEIGIEPAGVIAGIERMLVMMQTSKEVTPGYCAYAPTWHTNVLKATAGRASLARDAYLWGVADADWWCAMRAATPVVGIPGRNGSGVRFPTLTAAYDYLVGAPLRKSADPVAAGGILVQAVHEIDIATDHVLARAAQAQS